MVSKELRADLQLKWQRIQQAMQMVNADGCLLSVDVNLFYTTGQIFSGYFYLPSQGEPCFFVKRPNGITGSNVEYIRKPEQIPSLLAEKGINQPNKLLLVFRCSNNQYFPDSCKHQCAQRVIDHWFILYRHQLFAYSHGNWI